VVDESVSYVNAPVLAADRGIDVRLTTDPESPDYRNLVTVRGALADGSTVSVSGTLTGPATAQKIVEIDGFDVDIAPSDHMVVFRYEDRPGVVGTVGQVLGDAGINIASMQVGRDVKGGHALGVLTVDSAVPVDVLESILKGIGAESGRRVDLSDA
jgi:D-3-phosphoglycerate dehydrogenase